MRVRIKTWEEMEEEFGLDYKGNLAVKGYFTREIERHMPRNRIIEIRFCVFKDKDHKQFYRGFWRIPRRNVGCIITAPMVAEYNPHLLKKLIKNNIFKKTASLDEI